MAMTIGDFLAEQNGPRTWKVPASSGKDFTPGPCFIGHGRSPLEVAIAEAPSAPGEGRIRALWKARQRNTPSPLLLVVLYRAGERMRAAVCGPAGADPAVRLDLEPGQVERMATVALEEPHRHAAIRFLNEALSHVESNLPGLRNVGMFATHELREGVPRRSDWPALNQAARPLLTKQGRELVESLGFEIETRGVATHVLRVREGHKATAVAVFLERGESAEASSARFQDSSPVTYALARADQESLDYVVLTQGPSIRIYSAKKHAGVGRRGRADTFVEANLAMLSSDQAGFLPLLFSANALADGGSFDQILQHSRDFASELGARLRDRVYDEVVPLLARAIGTNYQQASGSKLRDADLKHLQEMSMRVLFRLLFISYAEDKGLLPYETSGEYRRHALKTRARAFAERANEAPITFDESATDLWNDVRQLFAAVDKSNRDWSVPEYNGRLFTSDPEKSPVGAMLDRVQLTNAEFGPALFSLLVDRADADDVYGPVDFRALSVREFGTIYEGLLEASLALAKTDLVLDQEGRYVPASPGQAPRVREGEAYLQNQSGARKATGSYFTKQFAVELLLESALDPALDAHIERVRALTDTGRMADAARIFFDFRCADIAMGSGHFLIAAVDHIEFKLSSFLAATPIPNVHLELERLRAAARTALGDLADEAAIETSSLLRRQIARRCIYGADINEIAVELARVAVWIHTFVPGLPLSFLDHSLVHGNSLTGIGTVDEAVGLLDPENAESGASIWTEKITDWIAEANTALSKLGRIADATAAEVQEAYAAQEEAQRKIEPARILFDLLVAHRLQPRVDRPGHRDVEGFVLPDLTHDFTSHRDVTRVRNVVGPLNPIHFPLQFPEVFYGERPGFACIVGNPPWDKVRFEAQQFWVVRQPGLNALTTNKRETALERYRAEYPADAISELTEQADREREQRYFLVSYTAQGRGHLEYAKLFTERALRLLHRRGHVGYVLPRQCLVLGGWAEIRKELADDSSLEIIQLRNTGGWVFDDVHYSYMVVLIARSPFTQDKPAATVWPAVANAADFRNASRAPVKLSRKEIESLSDSLVLPWLDGPMDEQLFAHMKGQPRLASGQGWIKGIHDARWDFRSSGPHGHLAKRKQKDGYWGVLMTRHVGAYKLLLSAPLQQYVDPGDLVPLSRGVSTHRSVARIDANHPIIILRHPSRNDDSRTMIASALPERGFVHCKGYVHAIAHPEGTQLSDVLALLGFVNSFVCDWWARRFVDRHVTAPVVNNLPVPAWAEEERAKASSLVQELLWRNGSRTLPGGVGLAAVPEFTGESEMELLARVEYLAARGFDLGRKLMEGVLDDFSVGACPPSVRTAILEQW